MKEIFDSAFLGGSLAVIANTKNLCVSHCRITKFESSPVGFSSSDRTQMLIPLQGALIVTLKSAKGGADRVVALTPYTSFELPKGSQYSLRASDLADVSFLVIEHGTGE